ncbi:MAG: manganese efflux pump MntP family protein [Verrucomicrobiae bacterium]|nr:manganese efflux pump MntP family protein [Verrucomicrobiae bacterium]
MPLWTIIVVAFGLAMDAVAVCVAAAASGYTSNKRAVFRLAFHFGLFQFLMPVLGWSVGAWAERYVERVDHWIAFGLLVFVGGRMIWAAANPPHQRPAADPTRGWTMVMLSVATSLDALAIGFGLALAGVAVWQPAVLIGVITAGLCWLAIGLGNRLHTGFARGAEVAGGVVLILVGLRILLEHLC